MNSVLQSWKEYRENKINASKTSNKTVQVGSDGKAPAGLKAGDSSEKVDNTTSSPSNVNNQYSGGTDFQALIDNAVKNKDYVSAAKYEQERNAKIDYLNESGTNTYGATKTNLYEGWLDDTDYSTIARWQMDNGASAEDVLKTYIARYNKADGTVGLEDYTDDELMQEMLAYINANDNGMKEFEEDYERPEYNEKYNAWVDALLNQLLNRDDFSYNLENDPLYKQYSEMYKREGDRAMQETLADAMSNAGGMNSYAVGSAQQANNYYMSQLGDKIPQLWQMAYDMYLTDIDNQVRDLGLVQQMDAQQWSRYQNEMDNWRNDRAFAYNLAQDDYNKWNNNRNFNYQINRDQVADEQWDKTFNYGVSQDAIANEQWDKTFNQESQNDAFLFLLSLIENGITPSQSQIEAAELTQSQVDQMTNQAKVNNALNGSNPIAGPNADDLIIDDEEFEEKYKAYTPNKNPDIGSENYMSLEDACEQVLEKDGKEAVLVFLKKALATGEINQSSYMTLYSKYRG